MYAHRLCMFISMLTCATTQCLDRAGWVNGLPACLFCDTHARTHAGRARLAAQCVQRSDHAQPGIHKKKRKKATAAKVTRHSTTYCTNPPPPPCKHAHTHSHTHTRARAHTHKHTHTHTQTNTLHSPSPSTSRTSLRSSTRRTSGSSTR